MRARLQRFARLARLALVVAFAAALPVQPVTFVEPPTSELAARAVTVEPSQAVRRQTRAVPRKAPRIRFAAGFATVERFFAAALTRPPRPALLFIVHRALLR